jgi:hypothetical protein
MLASKLPTTPFSTNLFFPGWYASALGSPSTVDYPRHLSWVRILGSKHCHTKRNESTTLRLPTILCVNSIVFSLVSILTLLFGGDLSHSVVGILVLQGITLLGHAFTLLPRASSQWASGKGTNPEMRRNGMTSTELWHFGSAVLLFMAVIAAVTTPNSQWLARRGSTITGVTFTFLTA